MFGAITPVVRNLLIINIGIYLIENFMGIPFSDWFSVKYIFSESFQPYQVFTYMFVHAGFGHLFGNMIGLFFFGPIMENYFGSNKFLIFYLVCGIGAGFLHNAIDYLEVQQLESAIASFKAAPSPEKFLAFANKFADGFTDPRFRDLYDLVNKVYPENPNDAIVLNNVNGVMESFRDRIVYLSSMLGASGAVFGILFGFGFLYPNMEVRLLFFPFFPIKAIYLITGFVAFEIYGILERNPNDNIAHFAHIGGMLFAFILIKFDLLKVN
ncbi:rhomboid family intramembrane serine protease [Flexithrix dorotheae]|uniref:rhomboid family intramembrane serine protease n=1 Tax=Flexithrix dorotheae TaxID=70993 RepID=UPI0003685352|nr:rhomboid family intramembrane serine protease [Flexithrix dorotheae]